MHPCVLGPYPAGFGAPSVDGPTRASDRAPTYAGFAEVPKFYFGPFDHVANEVASYVGNGNAGIVRRLALTQSELPQKEASARAALLAALPWDAGDEGPRPFHESRHADPTSMRRFVSLEELGHALDAGLEWAGAEPTTSFVFLFDSIGAQEEVAAVRDVVLFVGEGSRDHRSYRHLVLVHEREGEVLWIAVEAPESLRPAAPRRLSEPAPVSRTACADASARERARQAETVKELAATRTVAQR
jgi:hypothetical protein